MGIVELAVAGKAVVGFAFIVDWVFVDGSEVEIVACELVGLA